MGTGTGGISLRDSLMAMVTAVINANRELASAAADMGAALRIEEIQFVERWMATAIQAARLLVSEFKDHEIEPADRLGFITGGHHRIDPKEDPSWWHRIVIRSNDRGELRYNFIAGRARTEVSLVPLDRQNLDSYVQDIICDSQGGTHRDVPAALFELMIPNRLKEQTPDGDRLVLNLDESSAGYPWEMLTDRWDQDVILKSNPNENSPTGTKRKPLAIKKRLIRQLATESFRRHPNIVRNNLALVVGDPQSNLIPLPGARKEAEVVNKTLQRLKKNRIDPLLLINTPAQNIITALFSQDYRILHFAAHGVYNYPVSGDEQICDHCGQIKGTEGDLVTGMVIGNQRFLRPMTVEQIRYVPELVFLNCCHLGRIEGRQGAIKTKYNAFSKIAANLATQFIRMGTRAVIAAGWAVDDLAALSFATQFYRAFLEKQQPFGEAVHIARQYVHKNHLRVNTFGAYQCYGDPDHTWVDLPGVKVKKDTRHYVALIEIDHELDNLTSSAKTAKGEELDKIKEKAFNLHQEAQKKWPKESANMAAFGRVWGEMGLFHEAIEAYREAMAGEKAAATLTDIEQLANLESRYALQLWKHNTQETRLNGASTSPQDLLSGSLERLKHLMEFGATVERLSLVGAAYKRMATMASTTESRKKALGRMAANYEKAHQRYEKRHGTPNSYPALNWLTAEFLVNWYNLKDPRTDRLGLLKRQEIIVLNKVVRGTKDQFKREPNFWNGVATADGMLVQQLTRFKFTKRTPQTIIDQYLDVKHSAASPREFQSVLDHFEFLTTLAKHKPKPNEQDQSIIDGLCTINEKLREVGN